MEKSTLKKNRVIFPVFNLSKITFTGKRYSTFWGLIFKGTAQVDAKPTLAFKHLLAKKVDPDLVVNQVPLTPSLIKEKIERIDLESAFKEVSQVSDNLKRWNEFSTQNSDVNYSRVTDDIIKRSIERLKLKEAHPTCLPESTSDDDKNLGLFERTASNLKNDPVLENSFNRFMTSTDAPEDQVPVELSFFGNTNLGKYVLDNFGTDVFANLFLYFHDNRFDSLEDEDDASILNSWGDLIVAINFSSNFLEEMVILKSIFSGSELLTEEYRTKLISFLTSLEKDISDNLTLVFNSLGIANSAFLEKFKNSLPDLKILLTFFESINLKNTMAISFIKLLITALFTSLSNILDILNISAGPVNVENSFDPSIRWAYKELLYYYSPEDDSLDDNSCDFTNLDKIANELDVSDLESLKNDSTWLNYLVLSVGNLCFKILYSKLFGASIIWGSVYLLSKTIFFKNLVSKFSQFFLKK